MGNDEGLCDITWKKVSTNKVPFDSIWKWSLPWHTDLGGIAGDLWTKYNISYHTQYTHYPKEVQSTQHTCYSQWCEGMELWNYVYHCLMVWINHSQDNRDTIQAHYGSIYLSLQNASTADSKWHQNSETNITFVYKVCACLPGSSEILHVFWLPSKYNIVLETHLDQPAQCLCLSNWRTGHNSQMKGHQIAHQNEQINNLLHWHWNTSDEQVLDMIVGKRVQEVPFMYRPLRGIVMVSQSILQFPAGTLIYFSSSTIITPLSSKMSICACQ